MQKRRRRNNALSFSVIDLNENGNRKLNSSYSIFKRRFCLFWWVVPEQNCPFFWIDIHKCRIELQSVFIRNRRVSHCWKLSPIFDVTVILLLYLFFVFASKYSKPLTSFDSFVLSLPLHRQTNWEKILRFHLPHKIGNVLRMIPDLPCKGKYLSLYLYPWTIYF